MSRDLAWDGCFNVRDLGGLPIGGGGRTRWGALVRADSLDGLTRPGWEAALRHGVRTVIDLRNDDERAGLHSAPRPEAITTIQVPLDVSEDREFWSLWRSGPQFGTPLYYRPHLEQFPSPTPQLSARSPTPLRAASRFTATAAVIVPARSRFFS